MRLETAWAGYLWPDVICADLNVTIDTSSPTVSGRHDMICKSGRFAENLSKRLPWPQIYMNPRDDN